MRSGPASLIRLVILNVLCLWAFAANAVVVTGLYQAQVSVADQGEAERTRALGEALKQVVVKVSGTEAAAEHAAVQEAAQGAQQFVAQFAYTGDHATERTLRVSFAPNVIDKLLANAGLPVWGNNRPALVTWLAVDRNGRRELIGSESAGRLISVLEQDAAARGLPLVTPLMDLEDSSALSVANVWNLSVEPVKKASNRYTHDAVLMGRVLQSADGQWHVQWQMLMPGEVLPGNDSADSIEAALRAMINSVTERLATRYAVQGSSAVANRLQIDVIGVDSLEDYAALSRYLDSMAPVRTAQPILVQPDRIRYELNLKGSVAQVQEYLALERRLRPAPEQPVSELLESGRTEPSQAVPDQAVPDQSEPELVPPKESVVVLFYRWQP